MNLESQSPGESVRAYKVLAAIVLFAFVVLAVRLWQLQVLQGERYYRRSADNFVKDIDLPATRGQIRDRLGRVVVDNRPSYNVYVTPRFLTADALARLGRQLQLGAEQLAQVKAKVAAKKGIDRFQQMLAFEDIGRDPLGVIESEQADLPGVAVAAVAHRNYPFGKLAAHVLGYMNQIGAEELAQLRGQGYRSGDYVGRAGLERQWEPYLRGKDGFARVVVDAKGHVKSDLEAHELEALIGGPLRREPEPGDNVVLTIDLDLQEAVEAALARHHSAAAAVVEVDTGRVLAIASHPSFDPNVLTGHLSRAEAERLEHDPMRPLTDKVLRENFFPASTFKIVPALAALAEGLITGGEKVRCNGAYELPRHKFRCMKSHGPMTLYSAIVESCNVYFYHLGERVGMDRMARLAEDFGFGAPTGIGLSGEVPGFVPTTDYYKKQGGFRVGYTLNTAIGQGSTKVTVIQNALAYAALASGGKLWVPQLVDRIETPSGQVVQSFAPRLRRQLDAAPQHLEQVRRALCGVVNDPKGTAHSAYDPSLPVEVCGKSGTAQVRKNRKGESDGWDLGNDHAWFAAFAPARHPKIAIAVLIEHGGLGGHVAGPTGMAIFKAYFRHAAEQPAPGSAALQQGAVPVSALAP